MLQELMTETSRMAKQPTSVTAQPFLKHCPLLNSLSLNQEEDHNSQSDFSTLS
jgi:hypothetical protein